MAERDYASTFGTRLREARENQRPRLTQKKLAERVGVSARTVAGYEAGEYLPAVDIAGRIATILGVRVDELLGIAQRDLAPQPRSVLIILDGEAWRAELLPARDAADQIASAVEAAEEIRRRLEPPEERTGT
jgi:transcriptional regulator with XRE-family HTH domain